MKFAQSKENSRTLFLASLYVCPGAAWPTLKIPQAAVFTAVSPTSSIARGTQGASIHITTAR